MLSLPKDLLIYIVGNWLDKGAFSNLDSAMTNKAKRLEYLQLVESNEFVFNGDIVDFIEIMWGDTVNWFNHRHIKLGKVKLNPDYVDIIEDSPSTFSKLNFVHWINNWNKSDLIDLLNKCPCLTELKAYFVKSFLGCNWKFGPTLTSLSLSATAFTSDDLIAVGENCVNLRNLTVLRCSCEEKTVYPMLKHYFDKLQNVHFRYVDLKTVEYFIHKATNLAYVDVNTDIAPLLAKYCKNIIDFCFDGIGSDVNDAMTKFFKQSPQLKCLELNVKQYKVSDNCLKVLSETCTNIVELNFDCSDTQLQWCAVLLKGLTKLEMLSIHSEGVLSCAIQQCFSSVKTVHILTSSSQLHKLPQSFPNLVNIYVEFECPCNDFVIALSMYCPKLQSVQLFEATDLMDHSVYGLLTACPLLEVLSIPSSLHITDELITVMGEVCNNLTYLAVCGDKLTAAAYLALCEGCPLLKKITFDASYDLPYDVTVHEAIDKLRKVRRVELMSYLEPEDEYDGNDSFDDGFDKNTTEDEEVEEEYYDGDNVSEDVSSDDLFTH